MPDRASPWIFASLVLVLSLVFLRLGVWQMDRHEERQAASAEKRARLARPPLRLGPGGGSVAGLPAAESLAWRRVELTGRYDYGREVLLGARSLDGIPGVYVITPLLLDADEAVPVLRGWLPAPDGFHATLQRGRPAELRGRRAGGDEADEEERAGRLLGDSVRVEGLAVVPGGRSGAVVDTLEAAGRGHPVLDAPDPALLRRLLPYGLPAFYIQALAPGTLSEYARDRAERPQEEGGRRSERRARRGAADTGGAHATRGDTVAGRIALPRTLAPPRLDRGPHLAYAIQWFAFAAIALVGGGIYLWRGRPSSP